MGDANITTSAWRQVEVGRVVLFNEGVYEGRLATVVEIIDHKRVRKPCNLDAVQGLTDIGAC
jgi:large subunit ribosomal protein L14e